MKTLKQWGFVACCFVLGLTIVPIWAQLQQSGGLGSTVTLAAGSAYVGNVKVTDGTNFQPTGDSSARSIHTTVDNASLAVTGTFWQATQPVSLASLPATPAGTNVIGKTAPLTQCGTTALTTAWAAVPTSSTAVTATTTCVFAISFTNTNASAQTVTVTDGQGSPITVISAFSLPGNSQVTFPFYGTQMTTGVKWSAGGTGITGAVSGVQ